MSSGSLFKNLEYSSLRIINATYLRGDRGSTVVKGCTTNRKVAGSIPEGVIGIFH